MVVLIYPTSFKSNGGSKGEKLTNKVVAT